PRGEPLGVVRNRRDVLVAGRQPYAAEALGVRHRAALPQVVLDRERVGGPLGVGVGEVGRPVGDGAGDDLAQGSLLELVVGLAEFLAEAVIDAHVRSPREWRSRTRGSWPPPGVPPAPGPARRCRRR